MEFNQHNENMFKITPETSVEIISTFIYGKRILNQTLFSMSRAGKEIQLLVTLRI